MRPLIERLDDGIDLAVQKRFQTSLLHRDDLDLEPLIHEEAFFLSNEKGAGADQTATLMDNGSACAAELPAAATSRAAIVPAQSF